MALCFQNISVRWPLETAFSRSLDYDQQYVSTIIARSIRSKGLPTARSIWRSPSLKKILFYSMQAALVVIVGILLYIISVDRYLLFHGLVESFSVMVAFAVFAVGWNSEKYSDTSFFAVLGVAFLFVGFIDLIHIFAYAGMGVFPDFDANLPTQLFIAARYLESTSLLAVWFLRGRAVNKYAVFSLYFIISSALITTIFLGLFPVCYVVGQGLTFFKIASEYIISGILICSLVIFYRYRRSFDRSFRLFLMLALILTIVSELCFTLYVDVYGVFNMLGHFFKLLSFVFIYLSVVKGSLQNPYETMFRELELSKRSEAERAEALKSRNAELEAFAAAVSHDIRSPLSGIMLSAGLLNENMVDENDKKRLQDIMNGAERATELVSNLLRLSQIAEKDIVLSKVNLSDLAESTLAELREKEPERKCTTRVQPDLAAYCDKELMQIAFRNLFGNSWKYCGELPETDIEFGMSVQKGGMAFFIRDNGIGFDMDEADKIFKPFSRARNAGDYEGTGIGLTIVQRIIRAHSGRIWFESSLGKGTVFFFTLGS